MFLTGCVYESEIYKGFLTSIDTPSKNNSDERWAGALSRFSLRACRGRILRAGRSESSYRCLCTDAICEVEQENVLVV